MKRLTTLFFLTIILIQVLGCYVYFGSRLITLRQEMHHQLKYIQDDDLTKFIFAEAEFKKVKVNSHEIKVGGKMYDIARMDVVDNRVHVYALHDEAEDSLLTLLSEITSRVAKDKRPVPKQLMKLILLKFIKSEVSFNNIIANLTIHHTKYFTTELFFIIPIVAPPPRS